MTPSSESDFGQLPLSAVLRINSRCDDFEAEWLAGRQPTMDDYLRGVNGQERAVLLSHLTQIDAVYRGISLEEFTRRLDREELLPGQIESVLELPPGGTAVDLADQLIQAGLLTVYQSQTLLGPTPHPLVLNDYLILDRIASGGMGTVYRAMHRRMKREVAIKVFTDCLEDEARRGRWFQREAEAAGKLVHPNIVTAYDAGEARGHAYLVTEYVDGTDLQQWVTHQGPMSVTEAMRTILDAARGLEFAHACGVVHRDVKPSNLIRDRSGIVRVLDVGLARLMHPSPGSMDSGHIAIVGTPNYMAPEQAFAPTTVDARTDIYALGCTLFFLLTGRPVHGGANDAERMAAHRDREPPSLSQARPDVPPRLESLFHHMIARPIDERPRSITVVIQVLESLLNPPVSRRRSWMLAGIGTAALGMILFLIVWFRPGGDAGESDGTYLPVTPPIREIPFAAAAVQKEWAAALDLPVQIEPLPGMKARLIPPGRFLIGSPPDVVEQAHVGESPDRIRERIRAEAPRPASVDRPFYMGTTEVTIAQFRRFVESSNPPYKTIAERPDGVGYRLDRDRTWKIEPGVSWQFAGEQPLTDDHPVCNLGRDDASDFCRWLSIQLQGRYECRLPTEVEWEFACRAGSAGLWSCGANPADLGPLAWYAGTVDATDACFRPVGRKLANGFGLFDLHGNLEEWCLTAPGNQGAVLRGGHIRGNALAVRSAARATALPNEPRGGFRVVFLPLP